VLLVNKDVQLPLDFKWLNDSVDQDSQQCKSRGASAIYIAMRCIHGYSELVRSQTAYTLRTKESHRFERLLLRSTPSVAAFDR